MARYRTENYTDIHIQLKPYLQKYVSHETQASVLLIRPTSIFGQEIFKLLDFPPPGWRPKKICIADRLVIRIPSHYIVKRGKGSYISEENKKAIAETIESLYWQSLYDYVSEKMRRFGGKELVWIRKFREQNNTSEEDYLEESANKRYRRIKERLQNRAKSAFQ